MKLLVLNRPNINFVGIREKGIYGAEDYASLVTALETKTQSEGHNIEVFQNNYEGVFVDKTQEAYHTGVEGTIINPGVFACYGYALKDTLTSLEIPKVEVHVSNIHKREEFRHIPVAVPVCTGQVVGLGLEGYALAMDFLTGK